MSASFAQDAYDVYPRAYRHVYRPTFTDPQADDYSVRGMAERYYYPEPSFRSLPIDADTANDPHLQMPRQGTGLASSHRLSSFADVMLLYDALLMGPSAAIENLHVVDFEFIAHYGLSTTWHTILARLPNLKVLRLSGCGGDRYLIDGVSPFPSLGSARGVLPNVTEVFIDNVRCSTLNNLLSHLIGLPSLQFLSLRHVWCNQAPDLAEPPAWHHHFARLFHVAVYDCDDTSALAWLYASPGLINRLHVARKEIRHIDPFLPFFDARYIALCIRAFCDVQGSQLAKVKKLHYTVRPERYQIAFTLRNGATAAFRTTEPFSPGFGEWHNVDSCSEQLDDLWQKECRKIEAMLTEELRAMGQIEYTQEQLTKGCTRCKRI